MSGRRAWRLAWLLLSLAWLGAVAYVCAAAWPSLPLDLSPNDAATRAAFQRAIVAHAVRCGVLGLAPPLVLLAAGWIGSRLLGHRS